MAKRIRHIATRFALLLASAAVAPLLVYGFVSLLSLQRGTATRISGNQNVAVRAAEEIRRYVTTNAQLLRAVAANLQETGLQSWQQERILKNHILRFREFRELSLLDEHGAVIASSTASAPTLQIPTNLSLLIDGVAMSPIRDRQRRTAHGRVRHPSDAGGRVADRRTESRGDVADGRSHPHRRARLHMVVAPDGGARRTRRPRQEGAHRAVAQHGRPSPRPALHAANGAGTVSSEYMDGGGGSSVSRRPSRRSGGRSSSSSRPPRPTPTPPSSNESSSWRFQWRFW